MSTTRSEIRECIYDHPGIHFNAISRTLDIATGQTQYHLRRLARGEEVQKETICGRTHYYPPTFSDWERHAIALLRRETTREIVLLLLKDDDLSPGEIADRLDLARSTVEWHLDRLIEHDLASKQAVANVDGATLLVTLERDTELYRLLREIEPRFLDRLVDRFSRLTDELLDE